MALYSRIRQLREDSDKTQAELAEYLATTAQYYGKYEKGERELPFCRAIQIADYYNVSLDYLAGRSSARNTADQGLSDEERLLIERYRQLSEYNKGKHDLLIEQLIRQQGIK